MAGKRTEQRKRAKARKAMEELMLQGQVATANTVATNWGAAPTNWVDNFQVPVGASTTCIGSWQGIKEYYLGPIPTTKQEEKKGNDMRFDFEYSDQPTGEKQRDYLLRRLDSIYYEKDTPMRQAFGLMDDDAPTTANELLARIASGKFTVKTDRGDFETFEPLRFIRWRDPATKEDKVGFKSASEKMQKLMQDTRDAIVIKEPADGYTALQAFETATFN